MTQDAFHYNPDSQSTLVTEASMEKETKALIAKTMEHEASDQVGVTHSLPATLLQNGIEETNWRIHNQLTTEKNVHCASHKMVKG
jgi:hypothetical protein